MPPIPASKLWGLAVSLSQVMINLISLLLWKLYYFIITYEIVTSFIDKTINQQLVAMYQNCYSKQDYKLNII